jgi:hypothetical protein
MNGRIPAVIAELNKNWGITDVAAQKPAAIPINAIQPSGWTAMGAIHDAMFFLDVLLIYSCRS